MFDGLI